MKKFLLFLLSVFFLTNVSCSQNTNRSEKFSSQEDTLVVKKVENLPDTVEKELYDDLLDSDIPIGNPPISLFFINGERCCDFPEERLKNDTINELKKILKERNFIFDNVKILKDDESLEKYRKGRFLPNGADEKLIENREQIRRNRKDGSAEVFALPEYMRQRG